MRNAEDDARVVVAVYNESILPHMGLDDAGGAAPPLAAAAAVAAAVAEELAHMSTDNSSDSSDCDVL